MVYAVIIIAWMIYVLGLIMIECISCNTQLYIVWGVIYIIAMVGLVISSIIETKNK